MDGNELVVSPLPAGAAPGPRARMPLDLGEEVLPLGERVLQWLLVGTWLAVAVATLAYGLPYYRLPLAARADSPLDELLKPSGLIGQGYGVVGTLLITVGVGMYSIRKRVPFLRHVGRLHQWLEAHIFLCTLGPFLVTLHTGFKFGGVVAIAYWAMAAVAVSGLFGRYVYGHIPRALHGQRATLEQLRAARAEAAQRITADHPREAARLGRTLHLAPPARPRGLMHALWLALRYDLTRRAQVRHLRHAVRAGGLPRVLQDELVALTRAQAALEQQHVLLQPFQRLFHYWHVFHLPLTVVMFLVLTVHVAIAVMLGYTWIF